MSFASDGRVGEAARFSGERSRGGLDDDVEEGGGDCF